MKVRTRENVRRILPTRAKNKIHSVRGDAKAKFPLAFVDSFVAATGAAVIAVVGAVIVVVVVVAPALL
jgi:hypothetical protein